MDVINFIYHSIEIFDWYFFCKGRVSAFIFAPETKNKTLFLML